MLAKKSVQRKLFIAVSFSPSIENKESQPNNSFNCDALSYLLIGGDKVFEIANLKKVLLGRIMGRYYLSPQCNLIRPFYGADSLHCVVLVRFNTMRRALFVVHKKSRTNYIVRLL
nr:MAG TPA: hypothetical protein [Caudoviricetes sp.]